MKIAISCESTADLPQNLIADNNIFVMPLQINIDGKEYLDEVDITPPDIFKYVEEKNVLPKTAARSIEDYKEFFSNIQKEHDIVLHIGFSSELSCSCDNAMQAAKQLKNVYVIDSKNLSSGHGYLTLCACELRDNNESIENIIAQLESIKSKIKVSFVINTMKYLYKGGRCSTIQYLGASLLMLKPSIVVKDGKMSVGKKYMGKIAPCSLKYVDETLNNEKNIDYSTIFITYSSSELLNLDDLKTNLERRGFKRIIENRAGCTISSHCGPNCIGIIFKTK